MLPVQRAGGVWGIQRKWRPGRAAEKEAGEPAVRTGQWVCTAFPLPGDGVATVPVWVLEDQMESLLPLSWQRNASGRLREKFPPRC